MNDILVEKVRKYYRCAFRPNDSELSATEVRDFVNQCLKFYGESGVYEYGFTFDEICEGIIDRFKAEPVLDFLSDTVDREIVREMVFSIRKQKELS